MAKEMYFAFKLEVPWEREREEAHNIIRPLSIVMTNRCSAKFSIATRVKMNGTNYNLF